MDTGVYIYYCAVFKINRSKFTHAVYGTPYYGCNNGWPALYKEFTVFEGFGKKKIDCTVSRKWWSIMADHTVCLHTIISSMVPEKILLHP